MAVLLSCITLLLQAGLVSASSEPGTGKVSPLRVEGVITAVFTPYYPNGTINLEAVPVQAALQRKTGVKGVFVGGTTGDSLSLTMQERKALAEAWAVAAKANGLLFIVHVGAEALGDAMELTKHAEHLGAAAVGCMPSVFFKPATVDAAAQWLQQIGKAGPTLPLYYYHIPSMTGVDFKMLDLLKAVERAGVPSFVGVKYTGLYEMQAFPDFQRCLEYNGGRYEILCGREEMSVEALSVGAQGFIGSQFNFAADLYGAIHQAWPNMTRARELQSLGLDLLEIEGSVPAGINGNRMLQEYTSAPIGPARLPSLQADAATLKDFSDRLGTWCLKAQHVAGKPLELCKSSFSQVSKPRIEV